MRLALLPLVALSLAFAPAPLPKPAKAPEGVFEIDFTPMDDAPRRVEHRLTIQLGGVEQFSGLIIFNRACGEGGARAVVKALQGVRQGAQFVPDTSGKKLRVETFGGPPLRSVEVTLTGLAPSFIPKVRRLG